MKLSIEILSLVEYAIGAEIIYAALMLAAASVGMLIGMLECLFRRLRSADSRYGSIAPTIGLVTALILLARVLYIAYDIAPSYVPHRAIEPPPGHAIAWSSFFRRCARVGAWL